MKTWLLIAAERREFDGFVKRLGGVTELEWPKAKFAVEGRWRGDRWWLVANGPGPGSVNRALGTASNGSRGEDKKVDGVVSTGYCGALDPGLRLGDIVVSTETHVECARPYRKGLIHSMDRVAVTAEEKRALRAQTGADAVEMEASAVQNYAQSAGIPFSCIRVVSDTAHYDLPLDFNRYRIGDGDFSRTRIALAALARPFTALPKLIAFARESERASEALGDFLADCRF